MPNPGNPLYEMIMYPERFAKYDAVIEVIAARGKTETLTVLAKDEDDAREQAVLQGRSLGPDARVVSVTLKDPEAPTPA